MSQEDDAAKATEFVRGAALYWSGIAPVHPAGDFLAGQLAETRSGFAALRGQMPFEDEPSSFVAALLDTRETGS